MEKRDSSFFLEHICRIFADPIFILDENGTYVEIAGGAERELYDSPGYLKARKLHDVFSADNADRMLALVRESLRTDTMKTIEYQLSSGEMKHNPMDGPGAPQWYQGRVSPVRLPGETVGHVIWLAINITEQKQAELERDRAIRELQQALAEIKTLRGFLPLCAKCKKIRDDAGFWQRIEAYFQEHTDVKFTHSLCPVCFKELYPGIDFDELMSGS